MEKGMVVISSLLVVAAIILMVTVSVPLLSVSELNQSWATFKSGRSLALVEACGEKGLEDINKNNNLALTYTLDEGSCQISINSSGPNWDFNVGATFEGYQREIKIKATRGSQVSINDWQIVK